MKRGRENLIETVNLVEEDESLAQDQINYLCEKLNCKPDFIEIKFWERIKKLYEEKEFERARKRYLEIKLKRK